MYCSTGVGAGVAINWRQTRPSGFTNLTGVGLHPVLCKSIASLNASSALPGGPIAGYSLATWTMSRTDIALISSYSDPPAHISSDWPEWALE